MESLKLDFPALPPASQDSEDWAYPMRREMQEILPGLFLGPYSSAMKSKLPMLQKCGMTHIVCIRQNIEANFIKPNFQQLFRYLVLDIADNPIQNIIRFFPMTKEFIDGCLHNGGKVLIHGNAGISRSAALVIAYIMETFGIKYRRSHHFIICPYADNTDPSWHCVRYGTSTRVYSSVTQTCPQEPPPRQVCRICEAQHREAFTYVQERRFCINPNAGFVHQLQEYEAIYLAKLTIKMMSPTQPGRPHSIQCGATGSLKRTLDEEDDVGNMQVSAPHEA